MEPYIGQIQAFGFNFAPRGWALCNGQLLSIAEYTALFSLLGTTFGGNGVTTFGLPDLRGRTMVHPGQGPGLSSISWGQNGGTENVNLLIQNLPAHNHSVSVAVNSNTGEESNPKSYIASKSNSFAEEPTPNSFLGGVNQNNVGGNLPVAIRNPYLGVYYSIALEGIYPSRN